MSTVALVVLAAYQQLLPAIGLRPLLLLNVLFAALGVLFSAFFFSLHQSWSAYAILSTFIFDLIGGGDIVRITTSMTCIAAISPPEQLTNSYNYISSLYFLGSVTGSAIGSALLSHHVYILNACATGFFVLAAMVVALIPPQLGKEEKQHGLIHKTSITHTLLNSWHSSLLSLLHLFQTPNPTFTTLLILLAYAFATRIEILFPQYISLTQQWSLATVNSVLALKALVSAVILSALPAVRRRYLEPRLTTPQIDLLIMSASLAASVIGVAFLGLGSSGLPMPLFILALCVYTGGVGLIDSLTAYGTLTLGAGETTSDFYVRSGLVQTMAGMAGAPAWAGIFRLALKGGVLPLGAAYWICAGLFGIAYAGVEVLKRWAVYSAVPQA